MGNKAGDEFEGSWAEFEGSLYWVDPRKEADEMTYYE